MCCVPREQSRDNSSNRVVTTLTYSPRSLDGQIDGFVEGLLRSNGFDVIMVVINKFTGGAWMTSCATEDQFAAF